MSAVVEPATRPFVDRPVSDLVAAERSAGRAARAWGLDDAEPVRLLRSGMNAVFTCGQVVVRVGHPTAPTSAAFVLADRLHEIGVRVPRPAVRDEWRDGDLVATAWHRLVPSGTPIDWVEVGAMVSRLHVAGLGVVPDDYPCPSPAAFAWWHFDALLAEMADLLDPHVREVLAAVVDRHRWWTTALERDAVVCHGDLHPDNVVQTDDGPAVVDWDLLCRAPRGWDHGPLMTWAERWGGRPGEYDAFAAGYGWSARGDPFAEAVAELRLVAATLLRVRAGRTDPAARAEAERRLAVWRGDPAPPTWHAQ